MVLNRKLPPIGLRIIKSAVGVGLCFVIYMIRGQRGTPFYSALAVLWCIQSHSKDSIKNALQRVLGTALGAVYGMLFILLKLYIIDLGYGVFHYIVLSAFIIPVIYTTVIIHRGNASYFACVVYLSIVVNHLIDANPYMFVLNRSLDTVIGVMVGLLINMVHFHGEGHKNILFVADFDNSLKVTNERLTPYSRVTLQNLIEDGMSITIMTMKTPAAYLEVMPDIRPSLPIIAMDGAILYDINENSYPRVYVISGERALELEHTIHSKGFQLFTTVIIDDVLIIYYDEPQNTAAIRIYDKLHRSPYRNYLKKQRPKEHSVVYFMLIDTDNKVKTLYDELLREGMLDGLKVLMYPSDDYQGYSYLKIYNENASVETMIDYLKKDIGKEKVIAVADNESHYSADYKECDGNAIVSRLQKTYYGKNDLID